MDRTTFKTDDSCATLERFNALKAMNTIVRLANDEAVYCEWIYIIPDQADDEELMDIAMDQPDTYADACGLFLRLMRSKSMKNGGLYIGAEVYSHED